MAMTGGFFYVAAFGARACDLDVAWWSRPNHAQPGRAATRGRRGRHPSVSASFGALSDGASGRSTAYLGNSLQQLPDRHLGSSQNRPRRGAGLRWLVLPDHPSRCHRHAGGPCGTQNGRDRWSGAGARRPTDRGNHLADLVFVHARCRGRIVPVVAPSRMIEMEYEVAITVCSATAALNTSLLMRFQFAKIRR